jgi:hypothetical protein
MTKSDKFGDLNIYILKTTRLSFLFSQKYKVFAIDILHVFGINHWLHPILFSIFLELLNVIFEFLKLEGSVVPRSQKISTPLMLCVLFSYSPFVFL